MTNEVEADIENAMRYMENYLYTGDKLISFWMRMGRSIVRGPERERLDPWMSTFDVDPT